MTCALIIPAYNPPENLIGLVKDLLPNTIIMVNDGCSGDYQKTFDKAAAQDGIIRIDHTVNQGKGAALKTAFAYVLQNMPDIDYVITLDADGQHSPEDIKKIATYCNGLEKETAPLILGSRTFGEGTPSRSLIGNRLTAGIFFLMTGRYYEDTQTGLRAIPRRILQKLVGIKANRYEYEMDMLLTLTREKFPVEKFPISTIYIENNKSSHFNPMWDSLRIYFAILRFGLSSVATSVVDFIIFALLIKISTPLLAANLGSRIGALPVYFMLNKNFVFNSTEKGWGVISRFLAVVIISGTISSSIQWEILELTDWHELPVKIIVETILFFANFFILKKFVFHAKEK